MRWTEINENALEEVLLNENYSRRNNRELLFLSLAVDYGICAWVA